MNTENKNFYAKGRFFDSHEEWANFLHEFPSMPCDWNEYLSFMRTRIEEAAFNLKMNPGLTNKDIYGLLKLSLEE